MFGPPARIRRRSDGPVPASPAPANAANQSVIRQKYRERYEDGSCGDGLARV